MDDIERALAEVNEDFQDWRNFRDPDQLETLKRSVKKLLALLERP